MPQIDILMATYNGGEYIAAQIRSLQNQTFSDWHLIVHDDGSTDDTMKIVNDFCKIDNRIEVLDDGKSFHGPAGNFVHLMKSSTAPYMIFCDQDDIWLEDKLQKLHDATALTMLFQANRYAAFTSSKVASAGILMVLLIAPLMNGWAAAIMRMCASTAIYR